MNELTFLDLVILKKIDANSSVENFGSQINTSFFETANLLGTVKIKGYANIETSIGGISKVTITDAGMGILALAEKKAAEPVEPLDTALLHALAGGAKDPEALQSQLNIRSGDLAYHINKMAVQSFMDYDVRSSKVNLMLTEQGFNSTGGVKVQGMPVPTAAADPLSAKQKGAPSSGAPDDSRGAQTEEKKEKEDIFHILRGGDREEKKPEHHVPKEDGSHAHGHVHEGHEHAQKKHDEQPAPKSPEEAKKQEHTRRMLSKARYYLAEYWAWVILILIAAAVFAGAVYSMISRMA
ncbi:MAG: hypothetical protein NTX79_07205 [Candidatus Micrarchaeota archaeon]|nr:hypothetical protein [Candidatus Micrarchaeota archaeon]